MGEGEKSKKQSFLAGGGMREKPDSAAERFRRAQHQEKMDREAAEARIAFNAAEAERLQRLREGPNMSKTWHGEKDHELSELSVEGEARAVDDLFRFDSMDRLFAMTPYEAIMEIAKIAPKIRSEYHDQALERLGKALVGKEKYKDSDVYIGLNNFLDNVLAEDLRTERRNEIMKLIK